MTKTAQKTKTATTTDPIRRFWYDDELPFQSLAYQAKKLFELSSAPRHPKELDDITPYIDWLWANEPEDARKLQLERLLLEVMEETVDWALAIGSDGVKHDLDFRTAIVERFEDALKAKAMKLPDRFTKDGPAALRWQIAEKGDPRLCTAGVSQIRKPRIEREYLYAMSLCPC